MTKPEKPASRGQPQPDGGRAQPRCHVLLVDDEHSIRMGVTAFLKMNGFDVTGAC